MRIGFIGAGLISTGIATLALRCGHQVLLSNSRGPGTLVDIATALGCEVGTPAQAAAFGDIVVVAVPFRHYRQLPADALAGRIVMDPINYYPERDGRCDALDRHETTTSQLLAGHLRTSTIVKSFNAILARDIVPHARPAGSPERRALPIAGDDATASRAVAALQDELGFDTVDAGSLADSWRFERAKPAYCLRFDRAGLAQALARAERDVELPHGSWRL